MREFRFLHSTQTSEMSTSVNYDVIARATTKKGIQRDTLKAL